MVYLQPLLPWRSPDNLDSFAPFNLFNSDIFDFSGRVLKIQ
jgi:hypothetical protein